jgi:hypothetical protein
MPTLFEPLRLMVIEKMDATTYMARFTSIWARTANDPAVAIR